MIADVRRAILRKAREDGKAQRYLAGAAWNVRREECIPARYRAWALADVRDPDSPRDERFHLYLSGAEGTGKSCLLKDVHDLLGQKPDALPVWYRVDAPGLPWEQVETRLSATIEETVRRKYPEDADAMLPPGGIELAPYLTRLARNIQTDRFRPLREVIVFVDQLERTFESGDQPEFDLLSRISAQVAALLKQVEDCPVRVFIASRKQYLPDFLGSYQEASETGLHFNILQKIDRNERSALVSKIFKYCRDTEKVIDEDFELRAEAIDQLTHRVHGHPLEIVLALIHLFSQANSTDITEEYIRKLAPREHRFDFDIMLADKDPLDRHFLYAMAHARAEIVGFDEVWWRLHLVDPRLTERVERLNQRGVVEWLWLEGHLERSILPREYRRVVRRFFEFFHVNLRDHLLVDALSRAELMPPAWSALDGLSAAAKLWLSQETRDPRDLQFAFGADDAFEQGCAHSMIGDEGQVIRFWIEAVTKTCHPRALQRLIGVFGRCRFGHSVEFLIDLALREASEDFQALRELGSHFVAHRNAQRIERALRTYMSTIPSTA